jgi:hypothetical protein
MPHLTLETLARLVDEAPDAAERTHMDACADCRAELEALVLQGQALAALPTLEPGPDRWPALRTRLRDEGFLRATASGHANIRRAAAARAAAAIVLFLAGGGVGYAVRGPVGPTVGTDPAARAAESGAPGLPAGTRHAGPGPDAGRDVEAAGEVFMAALDRYMATSGVQAADPAARLAVLENIVLTTAEALAEAPTDPVISGYHLSALAQRNAVLSRLAADRPLPVF